MLLISEAKEYGYKVDLDFDLRKIDEPTINFWTMPVQHLRVAIYDLARLHRDNKIAKERTFLDSYGEMDHEMAKDIINKFGDKEQRVHKHIATGGMWNDNEIQDISQLDNKCKHCGEVVEDSTHVLWDCCVVNKHRKHNDLKDVNMDGVPKAIKYGIPLSMGWQLTKPFWHAVGNTTEG